MTLPAKLRQETHTYLTCPYDGCDGEHSVGHLLDGRATSFGPWSCASCGRTFSGNVAKDGTITLEERSGVMQEGLVLLSVSLTEGSPLYFVVRDRHFFPLEEGETEEDRWEKKRYFYEEHTCPTNFIPVAEVMTPTDSDPHGVFKLIGISRPYAPGELDGPELQDHIRDLFRKLGVSHP